MFGFEAERRALAWWFVLMRFMPLIAVLVIAGVFAYIRRLVRLWSDLHQPVGTEYCRDCGSTLPHCECEAFAELTKHGDV